MPVHIRERKADCPVVAGFSKSHATAIIHPLGAQFPAAPGRRWSDKAAVMSDEEASNGVIG